MKNMTVCTGVAVLCICLSVVLGGCENPVEGSSLISSKTISFTVPVHVPGDDEINRVALWINVNPIAAIDNNTTFTLISPYGTAPVGFDNDGLERALIDTNIPVDWLISMNDQTF